MKQQQHKLYFKAHTMFNSLRSCLLIYANVDNKLWNEGDSNFPVT